MNNSLKGNEILQSESSPSFKNLRLEGESPTRLNILHQKLFSQHSTEHFSPSSETPTMKRTSSFKNNHIFQKKESKDQKGGNLTSSQKNGEQLKQNSCQDQDIQIFHLHDNDYANAHKQSNKIHVNNENDINKNKMRFMSYQSSSEKDQKQISKNSSASCITSEDIDLNLQGEDIQNDMHDSKDKQVFQDQQCMRNKSSEEKNKKEMSELLSYNIDVECKYNKGQEIYSGNCNIHNEEIFNSVCFSCSEMLCADCVNIHLGHQIKTIPRAYPLCQQLIQTSLAILNKQIQHLLIRSDHLTGVQNDIIETFQQQKHEIQRSSKALIALIKAQSNELIGLCSTIYNERLDYFVKEHGQVRKGLNNMIESHRMIEKNISLEDPFITCDYYAKKKNIFNQILQSDYKSVGNSNFPHFLGQQLNNLSQPPQSLYKMYPQNQRININDKLIASQIEREYIQQRIYLNQSNLSRINNTQQLNKLINCNPPDGTNNYLNSQTIEKKSSCLNSQEQSPTFQNKTNQNQFISIQSSPSDLKQKLFKSLKRESQDFDSGKSMQIAELNDLDYVKDNLKVTEQRSEIKQLEQPSFMQNRNGLTYRKNLQNEYYFNIANQFNNTNLIPTIRNNNFSNEILNNSEILKQYNLNQNSTTNKNTSLFIKHVQPSQQSQAHIDLKNAYHSQNDNNILSNNSSACSNSTRVPAPISKSPSSIGKSPSSISKSPSPNKVANETLSERKPQAFQSNKEQQIQLNSYLLKSDKSDKDLKLQGYSSQSLGYDDKFSLKLSRLSKGDILSNNELFSTQNCQSQTNSNLRIDDTNNQQKIMKEIEEIKQILYQDPQINQKNSCINRMNRINNPNYLSSRNQQCLQSSFSATHSPNFRDGLDGMQTALQNNFSRQPQHNQTIIQERNKSPNFSGLLNLPNKSSSPNSSSLTPKSKQIILSLYNQIQSDKILKSPYQIEGFLNSIRKDNKHQIQFVKSKNQQTCNNLYNLQ